MQAAGKACPITDYTASPPPNTPAAAGTTCNSSNGIALSTANYIGGLCIFYDVESHLLFGPWRLTTTFPAKADANGNLDNCYLPSGSTYGVLSTSNNAYAPAYQGNARLGFCYRHRTVNVFNLVTNWNGSFALTSTHDFDGNGGQQYLSRQERHFVSRLPAAKLRRHLADEWQHSLRFRDNRDRAGHIFVNRPNATSTATARPTFFGATPAATFPCGS